MTAAADRKAGKARPQPPDSLDLAPWGFSLFAEVKMSVKGKYFASTEATTTSQLKTLTQEDLWGCSGSGQDRVSEAEVRECFERNSWPQAFHCSNSL